jgi:hypothetical protein
LRLDDDDDDTVASVLERTAVKLEPHVAVQLEFPRAELAE